MTTISIGWAFLVWTLISVICGSLCAFVAREKGRSAISWFLLGTTFSIPALIALAAVPALTSTNQLNKSIQPAIFDGDTSVSNATYVKFLMLRYRVERNEILGTIYLDGKVFKDSIEVVEYCHKRYKEDLPRLIQEEMNATELVEKGKELHSRQVVNAKRKARFAVFFIVLFIVSIIGIMVIEINPLNTITITPIN